MRSSVGNVVLVVIHAPPGEYFPDNDACCPHVAAAIYRGAPCLLRRHVADLALDDAGARDVHPMRGLRHSEIGQSADAIRADQNVLRRKVAVDDLRFRASG